MTCSVVDLNAIFWITWIALLIGTVFFAERAHANKQYKKAYERSQRQVGELKAELRVSGRHVLIFHSDSRTPADASSVVDVRDTSGPQGGEGQ